MDARDYELITRLRAGEKESDWNEVEVAGDRSSGNLEARFNYYDGINPDWPEKRLQAEYQYVLGMYEFMRHDSRDTTQIIADNRWPPNPVVTKGLAQVTMGSPQPIYNGGLLRATVRYFDMDCARPGLPKDVAALVDKLESDRVGIQIVNLSGTAAGILANIESQMELYLADGDKTQIVVLLHDVQSVVAYNVVSFIDKIDEVARDMGYTPDFHPSDSETRMVLRSQSNEN